MSRYYDRSGNPMDMETWAKEYEDRSKGIVARTRVGNAEVSTIWLGLDHSFSLDGPPLIFETLIFGGVGGGRMWRYATEEQAKQGHQQIVAALRSEGDMPT